MTRAARLVVATVAFIAAVAIAGPIATSGAADSTTTAVIVIDTGTAVRAVTLDVGGGMSGLAALQRVASVTIYGFGGIGGAVCAIDGVGNEATQSSCLVGPNGAYWAYFHSGGGASSWSYSPVGAGSFVLHGGDVDGWRYGTGQRPAAPPVFCDYVSCPAPGPETAAPGGGSGNVGGTGAAGGAAVGSSGSGADGRAAGGAAPGTTEAPGAGVAGASATNPEDPSTTAPTPRTATTTPRRGSVSVEAAGAPHGGGTDSGSPVGVLVAVGLLALGAVAAVLLRRRARAPG
jgi:hypothetical protein